MGRYDNKVNKNGATGQKTPLGCIGCGSGCLLSCIHRCTSECTGGVMKLPMKSENSNK